MATGTKGIFPLMTPHPFSFPLSRDAMQRQNKACKTKQHQMQSENPQECAVQLFKI